MKFKTIQASAFKASFEVLKDILNDVNVVFNKDGVSIITLDTARAALVDFHLHAENFEEYECDETTHIAGINITNTFKLLKTITNNDTLSMELIDREYLGIKIENTSKKTHTNFKLKLSKDVREVSRSYIWVNKKMKYLLIQCLRKIKK